MDEATDDAQALFAVLVGNIPGSQWGVFRPVQWQCVKDALWAGWTSFHNDLGRHGITRSTLALAVLKKADTDVCVTVLIGTMTDGGQFGSLSARVHPDMSTSHLACGQTTWFACNCVSTK